MVFGPHTANIRHLAGILLECGAGECVSDATGLADAWTVLLSDPKRARARGEAGWCDLKRHQGSAERSAELVVGALGR